MICSAASCAEVKVVSMRISGFSGCGQAGKPQNPRLLVFQFGTGSPANVHRV